MENLNEPAVVSPNPLPSEGSDYFESLGELNPAFEENILLDFLEDIPESGDHVVNTEKLFPELAGGASEDGNLELGTKQNLQQLDTNVVVKHQPIDAQSLLTLGLYSHSLEHYLVDNEQNHSTIDHQPATTTTSSRPLPRRTRRSVSSPVSSPVAAATESVSPLPVAAASSRGRPRTGKAPSPRANNSRRREVEKGSEEYQNKRARNNVAVRASRAKAKAKQLETDDLVKKLRAENKELTEKFEALRREYQTLARLHNPHISTLTIGDLEL